MKSIIKCPNCGTNTKLEICPNCDIILVGENKGKDRYDVGAAKPAKKSK